MNPPPEAARLWLGELAADTVWQREIRLAGDVVVPSGRTLTINAGCRILACVPPRWSCAAFRSAPEGYPIEATNRDYCDLIVQGALIAQGTRERPVLFGDTSHPWGGITFMGESRGRLKWMRAQNTQEFVLQAFDDARIVLADCELCGPEVGIWSWGLSRIDFTSGRICVGRCGVLCCEGSEVGLAGVEIEGAREKFTRERWGRVQISGGPLKG